jgi:hypothetical protein
MRGVSWWDMTKAEHRGHPATCPSSACAVVKLDIGDRVKLTAAQFERLAKAPFSEIESKFLFGLTYHLEQPC